MLNASSRQCWRWCKLAAKRRLRCDCAAIEVSKTLVLSMLSRGRRNFLRKHRRSCCATHCLRRVRSSNARCGVVTRGDTLDCAKMLVFLSRCSNPVAVLAIPAGTVRHRHSLTARRAAWRRSERRRRNQRRKRAQGRPSAGRRSKHVPLSVFDFERRR